METASAAEAAGSAPILEMRNISKTFPGVKALSNVRLSVVSGEVHALMGENGAGKSTLMKILSGAYQADPGGEILVGGRAVKASGPIEAREAGVSIIYQELALSPNLTVAENIYLNREPRRGGLIDRAAMVEGSKGVLQRIGATFTPQTLVGLLSIAERQMVEIARSVHANSKIIVMDEPTTALSSRESEKLFDIVRQLRRDGLAIIYISHRMAEVYELSDRVSVLRDGTYVGTITRAEMTPEVVVRMMVGRDLSSFYKKSHRFTPKRRSGAGGARDRRRAPGQGRVVRSACRRGSGACRAGRCGPDRDGPDALRCRPPYCRRGQAGRQDRADPLAAGCDRPGAGLPDRGPQGRGRVARHVGQRQHQPDDLLQGCQGRRARSQAR